MMKVPGIHEGLRGMMASPGRVCKPARDGTQASSRCGQRASGLPAKDVRHGASYGWGFASGEAGVGDGAHGGGAGAFWEGLFWQASPKRCLGTKAAPISRRLWFSGSRLLFGGELLDEFLGERGLIHQAEEVPLEEFPHPFAGTAGRGRVAATARR